MGDKEKARMAADRPWVRPGLWFVLIGIGGAELVRYTARWDWLALQIGARFPYQVAFPLTWLILGTAYGVFGAYVWSRMTSRATLLKRLIPGIALLVIMFVGGQWASRVAERQLVVSPYGARWDGYSAQFVVKAWGTPAVAKAHDRGDVRILLLVKGGGCSHFRGKFAIGSRALFGRPAEFGVTDVVCPNHAPLQPLMVDWEPEIYGKQGQGRYKNRTPCHLHADEVKVALADRDGNLLGPVTGAGRASLR